MKNLGDRLKAILEADRKHLDPEQTAAVAVLDNAVVKAGAGSGKTTVLSYRFLNLVLEKGVNCDEILTLTFTKKAAAEMNERIYLRLLSANDPEQLRRFSDATICTLDSFFSAIVRSDCEHYGLTGQFSTIEDDDLEAAAARIADGVFSSHSDAPAVDLLGALYTPDEISALISELASDHFTLDREIDAGLWYKGFCDRVFGVYERLCTEVADLAGELLSGFSDDENLGALDRACSLAEIPDPAGILDLKLNVDGRKGTKDQKTPERKNTIELYRAALENLKLSAVSYVKRQQMKGVFNLLSEIGNRVLEFKRSTGSATFLDISRMAFDILKRNKRIRKYYKDKFKYIMIDEFQDNNSLQKDILYLLSERDGAEGDGVPGAENLKKDKLFFVGDEKQSIYRFRGADVSVFKALSGQLEGNGGVAVNLCTNYRTEPELIEEFNIRFARVMDNPKGNADFEAVFEKLGTRPAGEGLNPKLIVTYKPPMDDSEKDNPDYISPNLAEAEYVASLIERMLNTDDFLIRKENGLCRPGYSDIAILLRRLTHQGDFERALRKHNIPYTLEKAKALSTDAVFNDFLNVLQLCLFPEDRLAYLAVLSGPLCRLQGIELKTALDADEPFGEADLQGEWADRYAEAARHFGNLQGLARTGRICPMLEYIWDDWGYRYYVISKKSNQPFAEHFESLWVLARGFDEKQASLGSFVDYLMPMAGDAKAGLKELSIQREGSSDVRIMTIHKSKGLEFPVVIVADAAAGPPGSRTRDVLFTDARGTAYPRHIIFGDKPRNLFLVTGKNLEKEMDDAETKRLLYVALTRARFHLVITGSSVREPARDNSLIKLFLNGQELDNLEQGRLPGSMVDYHVIPSVKAEDFFSSGSGARLKSGKGPESRYAKPVRDVFDLRPGRIGATTLAGAEEFSADGTPLPALPSDTLIGKKGLQTAFGTFCHRIMELTVRAMAVPSVARASEILDGQPEFATLGAGEKDTFVSDALKMAAGFASTDFFRSLGSASVRTEERLFFRHDYLGRTVAVEGVIDLLVRYPEEVLIVDYKTDALYNPESHRVQLELYREAIARTTGIPVRCALVYLRSPGALHFLD
ncbi:MAG: UvrD-helicase domain-containing protein [Spirochaetales bacterium]|nr:UvrD-helicase domain-containing protein [Spirochaetales bacterium]